MSFHSLGLRRDRIVQRLHRRYQSLFHVDRRRDVHRGGERIVGGLRHVDVIVGMNRRLAPERRAGELAAAVGNHLIHVHVELRAASRHPDMQRKHVLMLAGEDLVTGLNDQLVPLVVEPPAGVVGIGGGFLQSGVRGNHLARDQILPDAEMFERTLRLRAPQLVARHVDFTEAVGFFANAHCRHVAGLHSLSFSSLKLFLHHNPSCPQSPAR